MSFLTVVKGRAAVDYKALADELEKAIHEMRNKLQPFYYLLEVLRQAERNQLPESVCVNCEAGRR